MHYQIVPVDPAIARLNALVAAVDGFLRGGATLNDLTEAVAAAELDHPGSARRRGCRPGLLVKS